MRERKRTGANGGAAVQAGKMLTRLRTFFGWAVANDLGAGRSDRRGAAAGEGSAARPRSRLTTSSPHSGPRPAGSGIRSGRFPADAADGAARNRGRRDALVRARLGSEWTIPGSRAKNGKPHIVHLSALAIEAIEAVPRIDGPGPAFLRNRQAPVSGSPPPRRGSKPCLTVLREATRPPSWRPGRCTICGDRDHRHGAPWIAPHVADKVLNHPPGRFAASRRSTTGLNISTSARRRWKHGDALLRACRPVTVECGSD